MIYVSLQERDHLVLVAGQNEPLRHVWVSVIFFCCEGKLIPVETNTGVGKNVSWVRQG